LPWASTGAETDPKKIFTGGGRLFTDENLILKIIYEQYNTIMTPDVQLAYNLLNKNFVADRVGADWGRHPGPSLELPLVGGGIAPVFLGG